eukprot:jgi/Mesvir1/1412/Mv14412-RA.3
MDRLQGRGSCCNQVSGLRRFFCHGRFRLAFLALSLALLIMIGINTLSETMETHAMHAAPDLPVAGGDVPMSHLTVVRLGMRPTTSDFSFYARGLHVANARNIGRPGVSRQGDTTVSRGGRDYNDAYDSGDAYVDDAADEISAFRSWKARLGSRGGELEEDRFTVILNTYRRPELLQQTLTHYRLCPSVAEVRVVWSDTVHPPNDEFPFESTVLELEDDPNKSSGSVVGGGQGGSSQGQQRNATGPSVAAASGSDGVLGSNGTVPRVAMGSDPCSRTQQVSAYNGSSSASGSQSDSGKGLTTGPCVREADDSDGNDHDDLDEEGEEDASQQSVSAGGSTDKEASSSTRAGRDKAEGRSSGASGARPGSSPEAPARQDSGAPVVWDVHHRNSLNNRFVPPKEGIRTEAVFSVDDDVLLSCADLEQGFNKWKQSKLSLVGFYPRLHTTTYTGKELPGQPPAVRYGYGWRRSVWWYGWYSIILTKAAFLHQQYMYTYTEDMPAGIRDYVDDHMCVTYR